MKIHLAKPGGEREGPFTIEEINAGLAQHRFRGTDYWAWYDGLQSWVPLHEIPGVNEEPEPVADPAKKPRPDLAPAAADTSVISKKASAPEQKKTPAAGAEKSQLSSGLPAEAL